MPVLHILGVTAEEKLITDVYMCPIYSSPVRGPTFLFAAPLPTDRPADIWALAAVALLMQIDE